MFDPKINKGPCPAFFSKKTKCKHDRDSYGLAYKIKKNQT